MRIIPDDRKPIVSGSWFYWADTATIEIIDTEWDEIFLDYYRSHILKMPPSQYLRELIELKQCQ